MALGLTISTDAIMTAVEEGRMELTEDDMRKAESRRDERKIRSLMDAATLRVERLERQWQRSYNTRARA